MYFRLFSFVTLYDNTDYDGKPYRLVSSIKEGFLTFSLRDRSLGTIVYANSCKFSRLSVEISGTSLIFLSFCLFRNTLIRFAILLLWI